MRLMIQFLTMMKMKMKTKNLLLKPLAVVCSLFFFAIAGFSQGMVIDEEPEEPKDELVIVDMKLDSKALYARTNPVNDLNGDPCALIVVQVSGVEDMVFPEAVKTSDYKYTRYQVYVPAGTKRLRYMHPNYLPGEVVFKDYGITSLEGKMTYILTLRAPEKKKKRGNVFERIFGD